MPEHAEAKEWQRDLFREEDAANECGHVGECIANTSYYEVLE
jgi:hypothetical protein